MIMLILSMENLANTNLYAQRNMRSYGAKFDPNVLKKYPKLIRSAYLESFIPQRLDLSNDLPEPADQGKLNTCWAFAVSYAYMSYLFSTKKKVIMSPSYHILSYYGQKNPNCPYGLQELIVQLDAVLNEYGCILMKLMKYTDTVCQRNIPKNYLDTGQTNRLVLNEKYNAKPFSIDNISTIRSYLAGTKSPLLATIQVDGKFENFSMKDSIWYTFHGNVLSNFNFLHSIAIVGYNDTMKTPKGDNGAFKILNSQGKNWGNQGCLWISYALMEKILKYACYASPKPSAHQEIFYKDILLSNEYIFWNEDRKSMYSDSFRYKSVLATNLFNLKVNEVQIKDSSANISILVMKGDEVVHDFLMRKGDLIEFYVEDEKFQIEWKDIYHLNKSKVGDFRFAIKLNYLTLK